MLNRGEEKPNQGLDDYVHTRLESVKVRKLRGEDEFAFAPQKLLDVSAEASRNNPHALLVGNEAQSCNEMKNLKFASISASADDLIRQGTTTIEIYPLQLAPGDLHLESI